MEETKTDGAQDREANIFDILRQVQVELKVPKSQWNKFGNYNYRNAEDILEALKPLLDMYGLTLVIEDVVENIGDRYYVRAIATVTDGTKNGIISATAYAREDETKKGMDGAQVTGAASSYARKYALNGLFAIDDTKDADSDEHTAQSSQTTAKPSQKPSVGTTAEPELNAATPVQRGKIKALLQRRGIEVGDMPEYLHKNWQIKPGSTLMGNDAVKIIAELKAAEDEALAEVRAVGLIGGEQ